MSEEDKTPITAEDAGDYNCPWCGQYFNRFWVDAQQQINVHLKTHIPDPNALFNPLH